MDSLKSLAGHLCQLIFLSGVWLVWWSSGHGVGEGFKEVTLGTQEVGLGVLTKHASPLYLG